MEKKDIAIILCLSDEITSIIDIIDEKFKQNMIAFQKFNLLVVIQNSIKSIKEFHSEI